VEELGTVRERGSTRLVIDARLVLDGIKPGDSIAVNGCCLTAVDFDLDTGMWAADVSDETWSRTSLGDLEVGDRVNLERPVRLMDRLGGHLVQGHVDATGTVRSAAPDLEIQFDPRYAKYLVEKGSVCVDGISLTVASLGAERFGAAIIPHTIEVTNLQNRGPGDRVNLEFDVIAKYVENLMGPHGPIGTNGGETLNADQ
jgi:riboflavin synthase